MQMRGKESLFSISRMQLSLCKDNAKRGKESTLQKINTMAPACRDAKFCVSRARNALTGDMLLILHIGMGRS